MHEILTKFSPRAYLRPSALAFLIAVCTPLLARADSVYDVTIDTTSLLGNGATLAFDFIAGGGMQPNGASISNFSTNGSLGSAGPNSGSVNGSLPGLVTLSNASFFSENLQGLTLGSTISFRLDVTTNAPINNSLPDTFSLFLLDPAAVNSILTTTDPTGANSLFTLQIDGSAGGSLGVYRSLPSVPMTITATPVPLPPAVVLFLSGMTGIGLFGRRRRGIAPETAAPSMG